MPPRGPALPLAIVAAVVLGATTLLGNAPGPAGSGDAGASAGAGAPGAPGSLYGSNVAQLIQPLQASPAGVTGLGLGTANPAGSFAPRLFGPGGGTVGPGGTIGPAGTFGPFFGPSAAPTTGPSAGFTSPPTAAPPTAAPTPKPSAQPTSPPSGTHLALGVWGGQPWDPSKLNALASMLGGNPAVLMTYEDWTRTFHALDETAISSRGAAHVLTWEPSGTSLKAIANGTNDAFITAYAKGVAAWGGTLYLRPMHEMNGDWYWWGLGVNGNTAAQFVAAWRHMHDLFVKAGATNVKWVWSPNVRYGSNYPFAALYPGSAYVDWVALDGYNWGLDPHLGNPSWQSFGQIFGSSYDQLTALAPGKPMMIAEMASTENGGSKADWIRQTYLTDVLKYPAIRSLIWFNQADGVSNFLINSSSSSLSAFKQVFNSSLWSGHL